MSEEAGEVVVQPTPRGRDEGEEAHADPGTQGSLNSVNVEKCPRLSRIF